MLNFFTDKPFTGAKKKIAELLREKFGVQKLGIKSERTDRVVWHNIYIDRFGGKHHKAAEEAVRDLFKGDPTFYGCDVWVN